MNFEKSLTKLFVTEHLRQLLLLSYLRYLRKVTVIKGAQDFFDILNFDLSICLFKVDDLKTSQYIEIN